MKKEHFFVTATKKYLHEHIRNTKCNVTDMYMLFFVKKTLQAITNTLIICKSEKQANKTTL